MKGWRMGRWLVVGGWEAAGGYGKQSQPGEERNGKRMGGDGN